MNFAAFSCRAEMADMLKVLALPREKLFFQGAPSRRRRRQGEASGRKTHAKTVSKINMFLIVSYLFFVTTGPTAKKLPK